MGDWEEIKKLAADFQRIQLTASSQKLSEHNCIEIVQKLLDLKLIDILHSTNGKEYITPVELGKEILEELIVAEGRVSLIDLQSILNIDLSHIESKVTELLRHDKNLRVVLGQLVDKGYLDRLCEEINDQLQEAGILSLPELTRQFDLPADILRQLINERLGTIVFGEQDATDVDIWFTETYISRHKARIQGIISSITEPIQLGPIITRYSFHPKLFFSILDKNINDGVAEGSVSGNRPFNAIYTPNIFIKSQQDYVDSFFRNNNFIEYETLSRVGITDVKGFPNRRFKNEKLVHLSSCCIGAVLLSQVESEIEENLEVTGVTNIMNFLPSVCTVEDGNQLLTSLMKKVTSCVILSDTYVVKKSIIENYVSKLHPLVKSRAVQAIKENPSLLVSSLSDKKANKQKDETFTDEKMDSRKKKTSTKTGYGTQGREVKTKSTKKKFNTGLKKGDEEDEEDDEIGKDVPSFLTCSELAGEIKKLKIIEETDDQLYDAISNLIQGQLTDEYNAQLKNIFLEALQINCNKDEITKTQDQPKEHSSKLKENRNITDDDDNTNKRLSDATKAPSNRKLRMELIEKLNNTIATSHLYSKGTGFFTDDALTTLAQHFLKTIGQEIVNLIFSLYAIDLGFSIKEDIVNPEDKNNILSLLNDEKTKINLKKLLTTLSSKNIEEFYSQLMVICGSNYLDISQKKIDKKKDRQLLFNQRQCLLQQLGIATDAASILHLAATLHFMATTNAPLSSPGKFVPVIIEFLKDKMETQQHQLLLQCQENVVGLLKNPDDEAREKYTGKLDLLIPDIKKFFDKNKENIIKDT